ncbi:MAG: radical SAM protein [Deltaproteobacteria bacterium]|nr:radical SAM protein [Deltaproteobacteria bacterium]
MPNLVITNHCNLRCSFCFASEYRADGGAAAVARMSVAELERQMVFAGADTVRFCGGEPTLHPEFTVMLDRALARAARRAFVMTNGLWPEHVTLHLRSLGRRHRARVAYLVNVLEARAYSETDRSRLERTLAALDPARVTLGLTISKADTDLTLLFALALRFGIRRLRYSVAAPTTTDPRSWSIDPERDFPALARAVLALNERARRVGLAIHSDCGYVPPCFFSAAELADLTRDQPGLEFACHGPLDIGPGGVAWRCYGLYNVMRARTDQFGSSADLASHFESRIALLKDLVLLDRCQSCAERGRRCQGGCYTFRLVRSMRAIGAGSGVGLEDDLGLGQAVPELVGDNLQLVVHGPRTVAFAREPDDTWANLDLTAAELELLKAVDGRHSIEAIVERTSPRTSVETALADALRLVRRLVAQHGIVVRGPPGGGRRGR